MLYCLRLAIAGGKAQVRYIELPKFVAMVENLHDPACATIMLQNFQDQDDRGQVLGRLNADRSAITIIQDWRKRFLRAEPFLTVVDGTSFHTYGNLSRRLY